MTPSSKPKMKVDLLGILKLLKPLLLLIIPIVIIILNHWLLIESYPEIGKWVDYVAYGMCAVIGIWVLIRIAIYANGMLRLWRHDREVLRSDPLFVIETKMRARLKEVHAALKRNEKRQYDVPFYAVVGRQRSDVESLIQGSGIAFPRDLDIKSKKERYEEGYEEWHVGSEAVFVDISSLQSSQKEKEWKIFLRVLTDLRPAAPLNGVLVALPADHLRGDNSRSRKEYESSVQKNLQLMQEKLFEKFPVYLLVTGLNDLAGYAEFFGDLNAETSGQMLGWSGRNGFREPADLGALREDVASINARIEELMLRKMAAEKDSQNADRIYIFVSEFNSLLRRVVRLIERVFDPDAYLEPVSLRGFYFIGGISGNAQSLIADLNMEKTMIGDGKNMGVDASTMIGEGGRLQAGAANQNWFGRDFFFKKLIPESGAICRPKWVKKRQVILKATAAVVLLAQLVFLGGLVIREITKTSDWREESGEIIEKATMLLAKQTTDAQDELAARQILDGILRIKDGLEQQGLFDGATTMGIGGDVSDKLARLHGLLYQKFFLSPLISKVETDISEWDGKEKAFGPFAEKLIEYVRWSNPKYKGKLSIKPFVSREKDALTTKKRGFLLRHFIQNEADALPRMTDDKAVVRISKALEIINGSTRITVPLETGPRLRNPGESEWEWWQRLSGKLSGFSRTTQNLLKVDSPFADRQNSNINDQIYRATKMVGQLLSSILEMEGLIDEGKKKHPTWISSHKDFFKEMKEAAVEWTPTLDAVDKSEMRSGYAYDKVVVPLFDKEMAWVQTFIGLNGEQLTPVLDQLVDTKTNVGTRQVKIYREIGGKYLSFLKNFNGYLVGFGELIKKSGALVSYSTYYSGDELMKKLETVGKELTELTELENKAAESAGVLNGILDEIEKKSGEEDEGGRPKNKKEAQKALLEKGKSAAEDAISGIELKRQVLTKFYWMQFSDWLEKWQSGLKSEKAYLASLYWLELFDWFKPFTKDQMKGGSYASILRMNLFIQKDAHYFTEDIEKFIDGWLTSIPPEILALLKEEGALQKNPGLKDFDVLYGQVKRFKEQHLADLRTAATQFVSAVNLMEPDAQKTWRKLTEGAEAELNWDALEAFTKFKNEYEIKEGIALRNITGSLEEVQIALSKTLNGELGRKFDAAWKAVVKKLRIKNTDNKFPFVRGGPSASRDEALKAVTEFVELGINLGIIQSEDGTAIELTGQSQKIMDRIVPTVRKKFIEKCSVFKKFLGGDGDQMPELLVELVPGEIGKHYHWVRMFVGRLRYYDLSVYGDKQVTIDLASTEGGVKFSGLDVEKAALAETTVTKGDLGLLQLTYTNGRSVDKEKTKWRISSSLASTRSDGEQIAFDLMFNFTKPVPPLPILPE